MDDAYDRDDILGYENASYWRGEFKSTLLFAETLASRVDRMAKAMRAGVSLEDTNEGLAIFRK